VIVPSGTRTRCPAPARTAAPGVIILAAARGYALGWARASAPGNTTIVQLGPRANPVQLQLLDEAGDPVSAAELVFSTPAVGFLPRGLLWLDAHLDRGRHAPMRVAARRRGAATRAVRVRRIESVAAPIELGTLPVPMSGELTLYLSPE